MNLSRATKTVVSVVSALALAGGCKKKEEAAAPPPAPMTKGGSAEGSAQAMAKAPTGDALAAWYQGCWAAVNASEWDKFRACYADDAKSITLDQGAPDIEIVGADAVVTSMQHFKAGFPDLVGSPQLVLVAGRTVVGVGMMIGTNTGPMQGLDGKAMEPTGKKIGVLGFHVAELNDAGKVSNEYWLQDMGSFAAQLGLSPMPGRPAMEAGLPGAPIVAVASASATEQANLAVWTKMSDAFNAHDVTASMADVADDAVVFDQGAPVDEVGKAAIEASTKMFLGAFSDGKITAKKTWAVGDFVASLGSFAGTNDGPMGPMPATGKPLRASVGEISQFKDGKMVKTWRFYNGMTMAAQLGMMGDAGATTGKPPAAKTDTN